MPAPTRTTSSPQPGARRRRPALAAAAIIGVAALVLIAGLLLTLRPWETRGPTVADAPTGAGETTSPSSAPPLVDESTHILTDAGADAPVVVEFLDFECEVCGAVYPTMESLREQYAEDVTFAVRYFPLPGHNNSVNAALAVEAAAQQGAFEPMYQRMFETQAEWGEQQASEASRFRGFAEELGLDMAAFDAAVEDPSTLDRVDADFQAGMALGVDRTPTIFIDGERLDIRTLTDIEDAVVAAAGGDS